MPNHVRNILVFDGAKEHIEALKVFVRGKNGDFDFNTLIPMPGTLDIPDGSRTNLGMLAARYLRGMIPPAEFADGARVWLRDRAITGAPDELLDALVQTGICDVNLGDVALDNIRDHGFPTWYDWCIKHWETKWNAYDIVDGGHEISFSTAWSAPLPVIARLAAEFPDIGIEHYWAEEDIGSNCGHNSHGNGKTSSEWLMDGSNGAFETYIRCWGETDCLERDDDGDWQRSDCETCAKCG